MEDYTSQLRPLVEGQLKKLGWEKTYADLSALVGEMFALNESYMRESGLLTDDGAQGYYDDDDAFEYISDGLIQKRAPSDEQEIKLCELVNDFADALESAQEELGLIDWE